MDHSQKHVVEQKELRTRVCVAQVHFHRTRTKQNISVVRGQDSAHTQGQVVAGGDYQWDFEGVGNAQFLKLGVGCTNMFVLSTLF